MTMMDRRRVRFRETARILVAGDIAAPWMISLRGPFSWTNVDKNKKIREQSSMQLESFLRHHCLYESGGEVWCFTNINCPKIATETWLSWDKRSLNR